MDSLRDSQARQADELLASQQRAINELRNETMAACRAEAAARAALDEQLWLTDQRLTQRINELDRTSNITVLNRTNGSPEKLAHKAYDEEENTIHIRPPPPQIGGKPLMSRETDAVYVERTSSPRSPALTEERSREAGPNQIRFKRAAHSVGGSPGLSEQGAREFTIVREFRQNSAPSGRLKL